VARIPRPKLQRTRHLDTNIGYTDQKNEGTSMTKVWATAKGGLVVKTRRAQLFTFSNDASVYLAQNPILNTRKQDFVALVKITFLRKMSSLDNAERGSFNDKTQCIISTHTTLHLYRHIPQRALFTLLSFNLRKISLLLCSRLVLMSDCRVILVPPKHC